MNLTEGLHELVRDEPPYALDPDGAVRGGRRRRRTRQGLLAGTAVVAAGALAVALAGGGGPRQRLVPADQPTAAAPADSGDTSSAFYRAVRAHTPAAWTISGAQAEDQGWQADVDDGSGAGRLSVGRSPHPGSLQQHPCGDPEFAVGVSCVETQLDVDTRLVVRGLQAAGSVRDLVVVIVHADGGGVDVEADNATWPAGPPSGAVVTPQEKARLSTPTVTRPAPAYSVDQLVRLAKAVDALSG